MYYNSSNALAVTAVSASIGLLSLVYYGYKKGDLTFSLDNGYLIIKGKIKGVETKELKVRLPDASKLIDKLVRFKNSISN